MKSILRYLVFGALLIESCYGRSQQADTWGRSYEAAIPFELSDGYLIVVEGRIERLGKLRFVLDTGATRSVVDRKIADRLRVPRRQGNRVLSFDKTAELEQ